MRGVGATVTFDNGEDDIAVTPVLGAIGHEPRHWVDIRATRRNGFTTTSLLKKDAPAFALAVLEAAGYAADNSCAGDAVRSLKFQISNDTRAAEEAALDKEADALRLAMYGEVSVDLEWASLSDRRREEYRRAARKARELHKTETSK